MAEVPLPILDILAQFPETELVLLDPVRQPLSLEIGLNARDDGVCAPEDGDDDVGAVGGAEGRECGCDDDLSEEGEVDYGGHEVVFVCGLALLGDYAGVDSLIPRCALGIPVVESGGCVDANHVAEFDEFGRHISRFVTACVTFWVWGWSH